MIPVLGSTTRITAIFKNAGTPFVPSNARFLLKIQNDLVVTETEYVLADPEVTIEATYTHVFTFIVTQAGYYKWRWESRATGEVVATEGEFTIRKF